MVSEPPEKVYVMSSRIPVPGPVIAKLERKLEMPGLTEAHTTDVLLAAESSLRKDWERPEEDEAWAQ